MAYLIDGMLQAYENSRKWEEHHKLNTWKGQTTVLGHGSWIPQAASVWNGVSRIPRMIGGLFGTQEEVPPPIEVSASSANDVLAQDFQKYQKYKQEEIETIADAWRMRFQGAFGLDWNTFNEAGLKAKNADYIRQKADQVIPLEDVFEPESVNVASNRTGNLRPSDIPSQPNAQRSTRAPWDLA